MLNGEFPGGIPWGISLGDSPRGFLNETYSILVVHEIFLNEKNLTGLGIYSGDITCLVPKLFFHILKEGYNRGFQD